MKLYLDIVRTEKNISIRVLSKKSRVVESYIQNVYVTYKNS